MRNNILIRNRWWSGEYFCPNSIDPHVRFWLMKNIYNLYFFLHILISFYTFSTSRLIILIFSDCVYEIINFSLLIFARWNKKQKEIKGNGGHPSVSHLLHPHYCTHLFPETAQPHIECILSEINSDNSVQRNGIFFI